MGAATSETASVGASTPPPTRSAPGGGRSWVTDGAIVVGLALSGVLAVAFGVTVGRVSLDRSLLVLAVGMAMGVAFALLAATRFAAFMIVLVAVRASLDGLKIRGVGSSALSEPGVLVGGVLLLACILWLLAQHSAGTLVPPSRSARWLLAFAAVAVFGAFGAHGPVASLQTAARVLAGVLTFVVLEQLLARRPTLVRPLLAAVMVSLVIPGAVAFGQLLRPGDVYAFTNVSRIKGTFVHPNALAAYLAVVAIIAIAVVFATRGWVRAGALLVAISSTTLMVFTYARGAWAALLFGAAYLLVKRRRALLWPFVIGCAMAVLFVPSISGRLADLGGETSAPIGDGTSNSLQWRIEYWQELLPLWTENPVSGIGLGEVPTRTPSGAEPHSGFVQAFVETGTVGFVAFLGLVLALWRDLAAARRRASDGFDRWMTLAATAVAAGFLLQLFTENLLTQVAIHVYLWIPIAYATSMLVRVADDEPGPSALRPMEREVTPAPSSS